MLLMTRLSMLLLVVRVGHSLDIKRGTFLAVDGDKFVYGGDQVYLSGTNAAWINYGNDFGDNAWQNHGDKWAEELANIGAAGGNFVRVWVHVEGDHSPHYDGTGFVDGTDKEGTLISDLSAFLDECAKNNIFMGLVLFNGAVLRNKNTINLFWDDSKLETYLSNALIPMVQGLKDHPALGFWEVMNEAEGSSDGGQVDDDEPCFDFTHLDWSKQSQNSSDVRSQGPGWSGAHIPIKNILHLHNWVADKIHAQDPKALVSSGSWTSLASTFVRGDDPIHKSGFNHYSDECLVKAGGRNQGVLDFIQFHAYPWDGSWGSEGAFGNSPSAYGVNQPILVGEFPAKAYQNADGNELPDGASTEELVEYLYTTGYAGGFSWGFIPDEFSIAPGLKEDVLNGLRHLQGRTDHGRVDVEIN